MTGLDIRAGLPSASALPRLSKCAASWRLAQQATRQGVGNHANAASDSGHRIHKWLETHDAPDWEAMTDDEKETALKCAEQMDQIVEEYFL